MEDRWGRLRRALRAMVDIRWFGVAFALVQIFTYYEPYAAGAEEAALAIAVFLALANLTIHLTLG